jgi:hypothetical protein
VVVTSDGRRLTGEVVSEDEQSVTLRIAGIPLRIDRSHIKDMQYQPTVEEQYRQRLSELAEDDVQGRYELATWLVFQKEAYELAARELGEMVARYPQDGRFVRLREIAASRAEQLGAGANLPQPLRRLPSQQPPPCRGRSRLPRRAQSGGG